MKMKRSLYGVLVVFLYYFPPFFALLAFILRLNLSTDACLVAPASLKRSLEQTLRGIDELKKSMPLLADKLKRAIIVLTDMPAMAAGEAEVMAATSAADAGEPAGTASPAKKRRGAK